MSRRRARRRWPVAVGGCALAGALVGGGLADAAGGIFTPPRPPDDALWEVVIPGRSAAVTAPHLGRGTQIRDGALWLGEYPFGRADRLRPESRAPVSEVQVDVASGEIQLLFTGPTAGGAARPAVDLRPAAVRPSAGGRWVPHAPGPVRLTVSGGVAAVDLDGAPLTIGAVGPGSVELHSLGGGAIRSITLIGQGGEVLLQQDFSQRRLGASRAGGAAIGLAAGAALGAALVWAPGPGGALLALLALVPPALVLRVDYPGWVGLVEGLGLVRTGAWELSLLALLASLAPLVLLAAARLPVMALSSPARTVDPRQRWLSLAAVLIAGALACREGPWWLAPPGMASLLLPWLLSVRAHLPPLGWLLRDLPALAAVAWLGWPLGLLPAALWRFVPVLSSSRLLLQHAPRAATDHLFLLTLALPFAAEAALRATYLDRAWSADATGRDAAPWEEEIRRGLTPFWSARCGPEDAERVYSVVFAGGSSTGGAYQFRGEPEAFYPAVMHRALCAALPDGAALTTWNYGKGGRDTHIIARALPAVLERTGADAVVLYVGVNDILTADHTMTRRQREAAAGGRAEQALGGLARRSRLVTGAGLALRYVRQRRAEPEALVSEVPLPDARDNLETIAELTSSAGAALLLVSQHLSPSQAGRLEDYWEVERQLAQEVAGVRFVDVRGAFAGTEPGRMLLDENHLSREGHRRLAEALLPELSRALGLE